MLTCNSMSTIQETSSQDNGGRSKAFEEFVKDQFKAVFEKMQAIE